ncbi:MAG: 4Fe-4S binding protein [Eubacterium sp.]|jgi:anaerobic sulfite reductase subunit C
MAVDYGALKAGGFMRQKQKDTFSMRLKVVGGTVTTEQLEAIVAAANKYADGYVHLTARQGIEIPFVKLEDIEDIKKDLEAGGVPTSVCGPRVRTVTACQGGKCCASGCFDTYELAKKIDARYFGRELPHKFKFGITGCQNNCLKAEENDVGIKGGETVTWEKDSCIFCGVCEKACREGAIRVTETEVLLDESKCNHCGRCVRSCPTDAWKGEGGYILSFGGTFGNSIKKGRELLPIVHGEDTLFRITDTAIEFFAQNAKPSERFAKCLERIGWDSFQEKIKEAYHG